MADKKAQNLLAAIENSKNRELPRIIVALGIFGVGETAAGILAGHFREFDALAEASEEELKTINGIGPILAASIVRYFANNGNQTMIARLKDAGVSFNPFIAGKKSDRLSGKTFVITGTLSHPRDYYGKLIIEGGGKVVGSVSSKTDYLLAGEKPGSKLDKAKKLGVKIIAEEDFNKLLL